MRVNWTNEADRILFEHYAVTPTKELAELLGGTVRSVYHRAKLLGLKKTGEFLSTSASGRIRRGEKMSPETRFKPGHIPWCAGKKLGTRGRSGQTQFKPGQRPHNYKPVGTERITEDGYRIIKVSDTGSQWQRWQFKHRLIWEEKNGQVPEGHALTFRDGNKLNCTLENIELITWAENARRHGLASLPKELQQVIQLRGAIQRQINKMEKV